MQQRWRLRTTGEGVPLVVIGKRERGMGMHVGEGVGSHGGDHDNKAAGWVRG